MHIIDFAPPMRGFTGTFNTFRLGLKYSRILIQGERVLLVDTRASWAFSSAIVRNVLVGQFYPMAHLHAAHNHNQHGLGEGSAQRLIESMTKRYGPHKIKETSKVTVIYLERIT